MEGPQQAGAMERFCQVYWYPSYCYVRRCGHGREEAQDLVQSFFAHLVEKDVLALVKEGRAQFRTYFITLLRRHLADEHRWQTRHKRGGGLAPVALDWNEAEERFQQEDTAETHPELAFDRHWAEQVMQGAMVRLREETALSKRQPEIFEALLPLLGREPAAGEYEQLAARLNVRAGALRTAVSRMRAQFRACLRAELAAQCGPDANLEEEQKALIAALLGQP